VSLDAGGPVFCSLLIANERLTTSHARTIKTLGFGHGAHYCPGSGLVLLAGHELIEAMAAATDTPPFVKVGMGRPRSTVGTVKYAVVWR